MWQLLEVSIATKIEIVALQPATNNHYYKTAAS